MNTVKSLLISEAFLNFLDLLRRLQYEVGHNYDSFFKSYVQCVLFSIQSARTIQERVLLCACKYLYYSSALSFISFNVEWFMVQKMIAW